MVFSISTRGSSESVLCLFVLLTLHAALRERWTVAAVLLGLSTHWKIYPGVYGLACLGAIAGGGNGLASLITRKTIAFGVVSLSTFVLLGAGCYAVYVLPLYLDSCLNMDQYRWGYPFLHESFLYHLHRLDHRHNFSPYFYMTYLTYTGSSEALSSLQKILRSPLVSFLPQMILTLGSGLLFGSKENLIFAWFVQTVFFVIFNKVCTSQVCIYDMNVVDMDLIKCIAVLLVVSSAPAAVASVGIYVSTESDSVRGSVGWCSRPVAQRGVSA